MEVVGLFLLLTFDSSCICLTQETCTCSKSTTETLEEDMKYVQSKQLRDVSLVFLLLHLIRLDTLFYSSVSIVDLKGTVK